MHRPPLSSRVDSSQTTSSKSCSVAAAPPCFIGRSSSTHASIISVAGDVECSGYIVQRANLLTLSISCCLLWVRVSFVCPMSSLSFSRRHCDRHAQGRLSLVAVCSLGDFITSLLLERVRSVANRFDSPRRTVALIARRAGASRPTSHRLASFKS